MKRIQASSEGIEKIRTMLKKKKWAQSYLADCVGCSRATIASLLSGNRIDGEYFRKICSQLKLNENEIVKYDLIEENQQSDSYIDNLVQEVRQKIKPIIQERCGTMRVLDMTQPIGLNDIYTNVNILEKITGRRRKEISELLEESNSGDFERFGLGKIKEKQVPGLEAVEKYSKLMILGKPGAGKTTFLKYLAIQSIEGKFKAELVPIFITLKDFAEATNKPRLLEYISQQLVNCEVTDNQVVEIFQNNKALVLLDGLDEVREEDSQRVLKEIRGFSDQFRNNRFVMTCRIAAKEYTFEKFSEVEVADFDDEQIATFAKNWFNNKAVKAENFLKRIEENWRINQLATNPLLLTLLCLVFEESGHFPPNRSLLYEEGIDALLKKWDAKRGIYRDQVYEKLSVQRKEDLLSKIALNTFERSDYFFKQKVAEQYIIEYIRNLPDASTDPETLQLDSEKVLKSIEAQHGLLVERAKGIYSFSHLTFHEYFTAREFITVEQSSEVALKSLVSQMREKRWREVFLLAVEMSPNADRLLLLMKEKVDEIVAVDDNLQQFLIWVNQKSLLVEVDQKQVVTRAVYFWHTFKLISTLLFTYIPIINELANILDPSSLGIPTECYIDYLLIFMLNWSIIFGSTSLNLEQFKNIQENAEPSCLNIDHIFDFICNLKPENALPQSIVILKKQPPNSDDGVENFNQWWQANGKAWTEQLRKQIIKYRNIGHDWQFNEQQEDLLNQYYEANKLLAKCLNSDCYVSREVRQYIEDTLLLPISEIEKYPKPNL
ncbi:NACHT C-terminal helical domain 2-containing protein [Floridanema flaviceps]